MNPLDPQEASKAAETGELPPEPASELREFEAFRAELLKRTPRAMVTLLLVLANAVVFGLMVRQGVSWIDPTPEQMLEWGANFSPRTLSGEEWRMATCLFLHVGAVHLGMNMLALWNVGGFVERLFGGVGFLLLYVISGLAGSFASVLFNPVVVSAGASGAIFGVAGGLLSGAWRIRKGLPPALLAAVRWIGWNLLGLLVIYGVVNHYHPMIDNAAHMAGLLAGVVIGLILAEPIPNPRPSKRGLRNLFVAILGTSAGYAGLYWLPAAPADLVKLQTKFQRVENDESRIVDSGYDRLAARAITEEEYADLLESEVLSGWQDLREDFDSAGWVPKEDRELVADLRKVIELREAGWKLHIAARRESDANKAIEADRLFAESSAVIRRINEKAEAD